LTLVPSKYNQLLHLLPARLQHPLRHLYPLAHLICLLVYLSKPVVTSVSQASSSDPLVVLPSKSSSALSGLPYPNLVFPVFSLIQPLSCATGLACSFWQTITGVILR